MSLTKLNQQLRRDLKEAAATLNWAGVDRFGVAKRMLAAGDEQGVNSLMKITLSLQEVEDKLERLRGEMMVARINRQKEQP